MKRAVQAEIRKTMCRNKSNTGNDTSDKKNKKVRENGDQLLKAKKLQNISIYKNVYIQPDYNLAESERRYNLRSERRRIQAEFPGHSVYIHIGKIMKIIRNSEHGDQPESNATDNAICDEPSKFVVLASDCNVRRDTSSSRFSLLNSTLRPRGLTICMNDISTYVSYKGSSNIDHVYVRGSNASIAVDTMNFFSTLHSPDALINGNDNIHVVLYADDLAILSTKLEVTLTDFKFCIPNSESRSKYREKTRVAAENLNRFRDKNKNIAPIGAVETGSRFTTSSPPTNEVFEVMQSNIDTIENTLNKLIAELAEQ
ncbi:hypothetical protein GJ496_011419 [Pomphorhynchus laevis]|nr:hypothetical protein GJ496_011419 [Pomphorhynchus laevis]